MRSATSAEFPKTNEYNPSVPTVCLLLFPMGKKRRKEEVLKVSVSLQAFYQIQSTANYCNGKAAVLCSHPP